MTHGRFIIIVLLLSNTLNGVLKIEGDGQSDALALETRWRVPPIVSEEILLEV